MNRILLSLQTKILVRERNQFVISNFAAVQGMPIILGLTLVLHDARWHVWFGCKLRGCVRGHYNITAYGFSTLVELNQHIQDGQHPSLYDSLKTSQRAFRPEPRLIFFP